MHSSKRLSAILMCSSPLASRWVWPGHDKFVCRSPKENWVSCCLYFEKLATAAASVLYTWNTVINLVNCSTFPNLRPRLHSRIAAP